MRQTCMEPGTFINIAGCTCPIFGIMKILLHKDAFAVVAKFIKTRIGQSQKRIRQGIVLFWEVTQKISWY